MDSSPTNESSPRGIEWETGTNVIASAKGVDALHTHVEDSENGRDPKTEEISKPREQINKEGKERVEDDEEDDDDDDDEEWPQWDGDQPRAPIRNPVSGTKSGGKPVKR